MMNLFIFLTAPYSYHLLKRYLRYFQQEEYEAKRFFDWWMRTKAIEKRGSLTSFAAALFHPVLYLWLLYFPLFGKDPTKEGKLRLKMTERAKRILKVATGFSLFSLIGLAAVKPPFHPFLAALYFLAHPLFLLGAAWVLNFQEKRMQQGFLSQAEKTLRRVDPFVIGITGSYGKTSTKEALGEVMNVALGPTFWPKKGINTLMGNTRAIRQGLKQGYGYAIFEMGAYRRGSIAGQCRSFPPKAAIITAVGSCHLERFKTKEEIFHAKKELADSLPEDGVLVCCGDNDGARGIGGARGLWQTFYYGFDESKGPLHCVGKDFSFTPQGSSFTILWRKKTYRINSPLFGKAHALNLMGAFTLACSLGGDPRIVAGALSTIEGVENRLRLSREGEVLYLRDAYNSNPVGFTEAIDVMKALPAKKRLLMTPGMIELGHVQQEENKKVARYAAATLDFALVVGDTNKEPLLEGLYEGGLQKEKVIYCKNRAEAFAHLQRLTEKGDSVLIENDLPDLYESSEAF